MSEIDHEAAKRFATAYSGKGRRGWVACVTEAYLDMESQRDYWRTIAQGGVGELPLENEQKGGEA